MNNLGWILGVGTGRYIHRSSSNVIGVIEGSVYSYWSDHTAEPVKVDLTDGENPLPPAAVPETPEPEAATGSFFPHDCVIDDAGRLYARGEGFAVAPYSRHSLWTADGDEFTRADAADYLRHVLGPDHGWGAENGATKLIGSAAHDFELLYPRFAALPSGGLAAFSGMGGTSEYQHGGNWGVRANFSGSIDCTAAGIVVQRNNLLWWNGRIREIRDVAPALPQAWRENTAFLDAAPAGWILAKKRNTPTPEAALLAPISLKDDEPDTGVDAMSLLADIGTAGYQARLWIMAPMEDANALDILSPACGTGRITLEAEDRYTIGGGASNVLAQSTGRISVAGADGPEGEDETIDAGLTLKMGASASLSAPIGVKVMKRREIKVAVFGITQSAVDPVELLPQAEAALEAHLDAIFSKQINAQINVLLHPTPVVVKWDTDPENGRLKKDFDANDPKTTTEMKTIIAAAPDPAAQIHVYLVSGFDVLGDKIDGWVIPETNFCWIHGDEIGQRHNASTLADTIAHELGHVLVGKGHPDQGMGKAPLKGIDPIRHRQRLMCSGNHERTGSLLVKAEWDEAEEWMKRTMESGE